MSVIYITLTVSFILAVGFLASFIWATKNNQYDDYEAPSMRILFEEEEIMQEEDNRSKPTKSV
ncbi:MAG TPA: cbb3-type cytochrome oxidase assembly protein CcoS [Saprospiraceae bacterium]|nr:cbb3-type cytochrome oxidase assembly protein CcoS [Saprospiraceae bacterium]